LSKSTAVPTGRWVAYRSQWPLLDLLQSPDGGGDGDGDDNDLQDRPLPADGENSGTSETTNLVDAVGLAARCALTTGTWCRDFLVQEPIAYKVAYSHFPHQSCAGCPLLGCPRLGARCLLDPIGMGRILGSFLLHGSLPTALIARAAWQRWVIATCLQFLQFPPKGSKPCPHNCNGVGVCNHDTGWCLCEAGGVGSAPPPPPPSRL
jgi:hypothetical protein